MISSDDGAPFGEINRERARLFAQLCQGKIQSYTLRISGNRIVIESSKEVVRKVIKLNGDKSNGKRDKN